MEEQKAFERKVKRFVYGTAHRVRLVPGPGFIDRLRAEAEAALANMVSPAKFAPVIGTEDGAVVVGNIDYHSSLELCVTLLTAVDVRLELYRGRATARADIRKALEKTPFQLYLPQGSRCMLNVESDRSRLYHEGMIREIVAGFLEQNGYGVSKNAPFRLFFRLLENTFRVELSLTGEPLWRRGYRQSLHGTAPLREDLAQSAIQAAAAHAGVAVRGIPPGPVLIPFAGTGTFFFETLMNRFELPLHLFRSDFSFLSFSCFHPASYEWLRKKTLERAAVRLRGNSGAASSLLWENAPGAAEECGGNTARFLSILRETFPAGELPAPVVSGDAFAAPWEQSLPRSGGGPVLLPLNPPYGIRLPGSESLYEKIGRNTAALASAVAPAAASYAGRPGLYGFILCPDEESWQRFMQAAAGLTMQTRHFSQGGLDIRLCLFFR